MATSAPQDSRKTPETENPGQEDFDKIIENNFTPQDELAVEERAKDGAIDDNMAKDKPSREDLSEAESLKHEDPVGSGYTPSNQLRKNRSKISLILFGSTRRKLISGGAAGGIIGLIVFILTFISGPLQFIHLSQILQRNFFHTQNTVQIRNKGLFRYARIGQVEETRLGSLGSRIYNRTLTQLKDQGVEFQRNARGVPNSMTIDPSKNDSYRDLSISEQRTAILEDYKISDPNILTRDSTGTFKIALNNTSMNGIDFVKATSKTAIGSLGNGKIQTGLSVRFVKQAWDLPSIFHPLKKLSASIKNGASGILTKQQLDQAEEERLAQEEAVITENPALAAEKSQLKDAIDKAQSWFSNALIATAGMCAIRAAADAAVAINRAEIVLPATVQATDKIAVGSQIQSGQDFSINQLQGVSDSFTDSSGKSIWQGKALQATEGLGAIGGPDLPSKYAQAFSGKTTADNIRNYLQIKDPVFHKDITGLACSKTGVVLQFVAGAILLIVNIPDGETGSFAIWASEQVATAAAFGGITYAIVHFGSQLLSGDAVPAILSGPLGGNLMAYGAREMSNVDARSMGGVALDNTESSVLSEADQQQYDQGYNSEAISKRLFDVYDNRSIASKLIDNISPNPLTNASSIGSIFTSFGSMLSRSFLAIMPHAAAASAPYSWGFPKYGFTDSLSENPSYQDPYDNADTVAGALDQGGCATNSGCTLRDKAKKCFGVDINKDSGDWEVVAHNDVNPDSTDYTNANCNDTSDSWNRLRLFVLDSRLMDAVGCHQGDEQSCANVGAS